jgi:hypothetical protein
MLLLAPESLLPLLGSLAAAARRSVAAKKAAVWGSKMGLTAMASRQMGSAAAQSKAKSERRRATSAGAGPAQAATPTTSLPTQATATRVPGGPNQRIVLQCKVEAFTIRQSTTCAGDVWCHQPRS